MKDKLFASLKHEYKLLLELISLAEKQQDALVKFNMGELEAIARYQEDAARRLREAEESRIRLLMAWLGAPRNEAAKIRLSALEPHFVNDELREIRRIRAGLRKLLTDLHNINMTNRVLANKARSTVSRILSVFTNGSNHVCNVRV